MRTTFGLACMFGAATAAEFSFLSTAMDTFKESDVYQNWPTTRGDVKANIAANPKAYGQMDIAPLSNYHRAAGEQAHHNMMAQRQRLGMAAVGTGPVVGQDYSTLNSRAGMTLNIAQGLAYNPNNNSCYNALESFIISLDTSSDIMKKMYIPAFWAEAQVQSQDLFAITSMLYVDCALSKMFTTVSHLFSSEGVSELSGRMLGAYPFEIRKCQECYNDPDSFDTAERGFRYGKCLSVVLNYTI